MNILYEFEVHKIGGFYRLTSFFKKKTFFIYNQILRILADLLCNFIRLRYANSN